LLVFHEPNEGSDPTIFTVWPKLVVRSSLKVTDTEVVIAQLVVVVVVLVVVLVLIVLAVDVESEVGLIDVAIVVELDAAAEQDKQSTLYQVNTSAVSAGC
jgi:hypothetical protein